MIGSDSEDPVDLYRTYNHTVRSALSVTTDGSTAAVTGRDPAQAASGFTAQLQAVYDAAETRYYWTPRSAPDVTDLTYYRRTQVNVDSVVGCRAGEARARTRFRFYHSRSAAAAIVTPRRTTACAGRTGRDLDRAGVPVGPRGVATPPRAAAAASA